MDDARYVLFQELKEKNTTKNSAYRKVRGGGRVRFPTDTLTRKELRALNGEVATMRLAVPLTWSEFLKLPGDLRREYLEKLDGRFAQTNGMLSEMFGVSSATVVRMRNELGVRRPTGKCPPSAEQVKAWKEWLNPAAGKPEESKAEPEENASSCDVLGTVPIEPHKDVAEQLSALLRGLAGSGAKITIEVVL